MDDIFTGLDNLTSSIKALKEGGTG